MINCIDCIKRKIVSFKSAFFDVHKLNLNGVCDCNKITKLAPNPKPLCKMIVFMCLNNLAKCFWINNCLSDVMHFQNFGCFLLSGKQGTNSQIWAICSTPDPGHRMYMHMQVVLYTTTCTYHYHRIFSTKVYLRGMHMIFLSFAFGPTILRC